MTKASGARMTVFVAAFGLAVTLGMLALSGAQAAYDTGVGAVLALANFVALRSLVARVVDGETHQKGTVLGLLFFKMGAIMALVYLVIAKHWVEPIPFIIGLSSLIAGLLSSALAIGRIEPSRNASES